MQSSMQIGHFVTVKSVTLEVFESEEEEEEEDESAIEGRKHFRVVADATAKDEAGGGE